MADGPGIERHAFGPEGGIPNSRLPLLLARGRLPREARSPDAARRLLERNGWTGTWIYGVFPFWHFHAKGHEVLACVSGEALIGFGGNGGIETRIKPGDVCLVPAGVGHRLLEGSGDFLVAGGYPPGQEGDINRPGELPEELAGKAIAALALPEADPISGRPDGMAAIWREAGVP